MANYQIVIGDRNDPNYQWLQATQNIMPGDEILSEKPIVNLDVGLAEFFDEDRLHNSRKGFEVLRRAVAVLSQHDRALFDSLHNCEPRKGPVGVIQANAFVEDEDRNAQTYHRTIVCNEISRVNHSCQPNAELHWNVNADTGSLRALQHIAPGQEIFINYLGCRHSLYTRNHRRAQIRDRWSFECQCGICVLGGEDLALDDHFRGDARRLYDALATHANPQRNINNQMTLALTEVAGYIMRLKQLNIRDGRLAHAYNVLADLHSKLFPIARDYIIATGQHSDDCDCHQNGGAVWHLRESLKAWNDCLGLDILTHAPDHPQIKKDVDAIINLHVLMNRS